VAVPEMVAPAMQTGRAPARSTSRPVSGPEKKYIATLETRDRSAIFVIGSIKATYTRKIISFAADF